MLNVLLILMSIYIGQQKSYATIKHGNITPIRSSSEGLYHEICSKEEAISFQTRYVVDRRVSAGRIIKNTPGVPGKLRIEWKLTYNGSKLIHKEKLNQVTIHPPKDEILLISPQGYRLSRGHFKRGKVLTMHATAYDTSPGSNGGYRCTKLGTPLQYGVVAVDPRVIPLKSVVYVEGYGIAVAQDTGGAIKGNKIDLCFPTSRAVTRFGRRKVQVHIMSAY